MRTRVGTSIGLTLVLALLSLTLGRWALPLLYRGTFDYGASANDPLVWTHLYVSLIALGLLPAVIGLLLSVEGVLEGDGRWAWPAVALNAIFVLTAGRLAWVLGQQGFFGFVLTAMKTFIEV